MPKRKKKKKSQPEYTANLRVSFDVEVNFSAANRRQAEKRAVEITKDWVSRENRRKIDACVMETDVEVELDDVEKDENL